MLDNEVSTKSPKSRSRGIFKKSNTQDSKGNGRGGDKGDWRR